MRPSIGKDRAEPRIRTMVRATIRDSRSQRDICIVDVSTRGILATSAEPPPRGEIVTMQIGRNFLTGRVAWAGQRRFGVTLRERISVAAMLEGGKSPVQLNRCGAGQFRSGGTSEGLRANPGMIGRLAQYTVLVLAALGAALLIVRFTGEGLVPLQEALFAVNSH